MKKSVVLLFAGIIALATIQTTKADTLAQWTFESLTISSGNTNATSAFGIAADAGSGTASISHASASTIFSTPAGNASAKSLSANNWSSGDYFQFTLSSVGFQGISLTIDQTGSNTGPGSYHLAYSLDGTSFTTFGSSYTITNDNWSASGSPKIVSTRSFDLSAITTLDNASSIYFRVVDDSTTSINFGTVAAAGTSRIDNVIINGTLIPVPEPSTIALAGIGGVAALVALRRRK